MVSGERSMSIYKHKTTGDERFTRVKNWHGELQILVFKA